MTTQRRVLVGLGILGGLVLAAAGGAYAYYSWALGAALPAGKSVAVEVPRGASTAAVARRLKAVGAIRDPRVFVFYARRSGYATKLRPGDYRFRSGETVQRILARIAAGDAESRWVTIPEGKTAGQVAELLAERGFGREQAFLQWMKRKPAHLGLTVPVSRVSLEGYLMPDTYRFSAAASEKEIVRALLATWKAKVLKPHEALIATSDLPLDQVVIAASMIEREARVAKDRALISSVIRNRLKKKMPLQIDATVIYALGRHKNALTYADLKYESPYNTYRHAGLPPGPICSPGEASILAALKPAKTPYLYYVAQPDGSHLFTRTYEEHRAAIKKVRAMRAKKQL